MKDLIKIRLAGIDLLIDLIFTATAKSFQRFESTEELRSNPPIVHIQESDKEDWLTAWNSEFNSHAEYSSLCVSISEELLNSNCFVMHAVAFIWNEKAWLLSAPSGIGKSTQYKNLSELYPEEIQIISGDRPVLEIREDRSVYVHPSPWNGKENWWGTQSAPLAGIFFLERGDNAIGKMTREEAAVKVYPSIFQSFNTKEVIQKVAGVATRLLGSCDCWLLTNRGDYASSELIYQTMKEWNSKV